MKSILLAALLLCCVSTVEARGFRRSGCADGSCSASQTQTADLTPKKFDREAAPSDADQCRNPNCKCDPCICGPMCDCGYRGEAKRSRGWRVFGRCRGGRCG